MALTAIRVEKTRLRRGIALESLADMVSIVLLILGAILAIGFLMMFSFWGLLASASSMTGSFISWLLFRCLAEHLRLQKKIAGVNFEGAITGPHEEIIWSCGNCGQMLHSESRCESCGAQIDTDDV